MEKEDFKVGQKVFVRLTGNKSRGKTGEDLIEEWEVITIGRKYIACCKIGHRPDFSSIMFDIEKGFKEKTDYCVNFELHASRQEILNDMEKVKLIDNLRIVFDWSSGKSKKLSLDTLRDIEKTINEELSNFS